MDKLLLKRQILSKTFNSIVDQIVSSNTIIISENKNNITVNGTTIKNRYSLWYIQDTKFNFKKSAIAYAICLNIKQKQLGETIKIHDGSCGKLQEDIIYYNTTIKNSKSNFKRISVLNRLSYTLPRLENARYNLDQSLRQVRIA